MSPWQHKAYSESSAYVYCATLGVTFDHCQWSRSAVDDVTIVSRFVKWLRQALLMIQCLFEARLVLKAHCMIHSHCRLLFKAWLVILHLCAAFHLHTEVLFCSCDLDLYLMTLTWIWHRYSAYRTKNEFSKPLLSKIRALQTDGCTGRCDEFHITSAFVRCAQKMEYLTSILAQHLHSFLPRCIYAGRSLRQQTCPSVCPSHAWIVTKRKHLAKKVQLWLIGSRLRAFQWA